MQQDLGGVQPSKPPIHGLVDLAVVDGRALEAHAADQADSSQFHDDLRSGRVVSRLVAERTDEPPEQLSSVWRFAHVIE